MACRELQMHLVMLEWVFDGQQSHARKQVALQGGLWCHQSNEPVEQGCTASGHRCQAMCWSGQNVRDSRLSLRPEHEATKIYSRLSVLLYHGAEFGWAVTENSFANTSSQPRHFGGDRMEWIGQNLRCTLLRTPAQHTPSKFWVTLVTGPDPPYQQLPYLFFHRSLDGLPKEPYFNCLTCRGTRLWVLSSISSIVKKLHLPTFWRGLEITGPARIQYLHQRLLQ